MRALDRQAARRQTYSLVALGMIVVLGAVAIGMLMVSMRKKTRDVYRDPLLALRDIFAPKESIYRRTHGRYATLAELAKEGVISDEVLAGPVSGFLYKAEVVETDRFLITAAPVGEPPKVEQPEGAPPRREIPRRYWSVDESHTIKSDVGPVTSMSPIIWSPREGGPR